MLRIPQWSRLRQQLLQNRFASDEGQLAEIVATESEEIEHVQRRRRLDRGALRLTRAELGARLQHVEIGVTGFVGHDQLAIQDHAVEWNRLHRPRDFGERLREVEPLARIENRLAVLARGAHAVTVELHLEHPALFRKRVLARLGQHQVCVLDAQRTFRCTQLLELLLDRLRALLGRAQLVVAEPGQHRLVGIRLR